MLSPDENAQSRPSWLTGAALCYLALPNLLFAAGWLHPTAAIVMIVAVLFLIVRLSRHSGLASGLPRGKRAGAGLWCALALVLGGWIVSTGMTGHCGQLPDYIVRNALYASLVRCDWPLVLPNGADFIYYLSSWLPPALVARLHPEGSFPLWCLGGWCFLGLLLMCLLMERKLGKRIWVFLALFILAGCVASWIRLGVREIYGKELIICKPFALFFSNGSAPQLTNTFHHAIPVWLLLSLYFSGALSWGKTVCASSLALLASPLGSIGIAIFLVFVFVVRNRKMIWGGRGQIRELCSLLKEPAFYCGVVTGIVALLYFKASESGTSLSFVWQCLPPDPLGVKIGKCAVGAFAGTGITVLLVFWVAYATRHLKEPLVWLVTGMLLLFPLVVVGVYNNEILFKASCIPYWIMAWLLTIWLPQADRKQKLCIAVFVLLSAGGAAEMLSFCAQSLKQPPESRIQSAWQGYLYHPDHFFFSQFDGHLPSSPPLFLTEAGASGKTLLSWCRTDIRSDTETLPPPSLWVGSQRSSRSSQ